MAEIIHEIKMTVSPDKAFQALSTLEGLKSWHTAHIEGTPQLNGILTFKANGKPAFRWKIVQLEPNKKIVWECVEGPGDAAGTQAVYTLSTTKDHRTLVEFSHTSWPSQQGSFRKCNTLWGILLHHLKKYVETGKAEPALN